MTTFEDVFGRSKDGSWSAPGRVNLIGEHTDYNDGFVLPVAIDRRCTATLARRDDDVLRCWSVQHGEGLALRVGDVSATTTSGWSGYALGVAWALQQSGVDVPGADLLIDSNVPSGAGLSSSAALECSVGLGLLELAGVEVDPVALARAAQRAECEVVGAPVGIMDQMASVLGRAGHALFLDCRSLETRHVPLHLEEHGLRLLVIDTRVTHAHASGGYAARRRACEQAAALLGVAALRDSTPEQVEAAAQVLGEERTRRARHVVSENLRVLDAVRALDSGDIWQLAGLMAASHASLRDDFEVSVPELDVAVEAAVAAGALGARMTGGGFGGSAVALVPAEAVEGVCFAVVAAADRAGLRTPGLHQVATSDGAGRTG